VIRPAVAAETSAETEVVVASVRESGSTDDWLEGAEDEGGVKELPLDEVCEL
jgi:hypothetical protein